MIDDENHPVMQAAARDLQKQLDALVAGGVQFDTAGVEKIRDLIRNVRQHWMLQGVELPDLTVLPLVKQRRVKIFRRDLPRKEIEIVIQNLVTEFPWIDFEEVAIGVKTAWEYKA